MTNTEFRNLPRNTNGDLLDLFDHFLSLTPKQVLLLTEDDRYRINQYREELAIEMGAL